MEQGNSMLLETRENARGRFMRLLDGYAAQGPKGFIDGFDATDELTGECGFALKCGELIYPFTVAEGGLILAVLRDIAAERPDLAKLEGVPTLIDAVQTMIARASLQTS